MPRWTIAGRRDSPKERAPHSKPASLVQRLVAIAHAEASAGPRTHLQLFASHSSQSTREAIATAVAGASLTRRERVRGRRARPHPGPHGLCQPARRPYICNAQTPVTAFHHSPAANACEPRRGRDGQSHALRSAASACFCFWLPARCCSALHSGCIFVGENEQRRRGTCQLCVRGTHRPTLFAATLSICSTAGRAFSRYCTAFLQHNSTLRELSLSESVDCLFTVPDGMSDKRAVIVLTV